MNSMIKRSNRLLYRVNQTPLCANVYDYSGGGGGGGFNGSFSRLVPASEVGFSSSGNTIGVLNTKFVPSTITNPDRLLFGFPTSIQTDVSSGGRTDVPLSVRFSTSSDVAIVQSVSEQPYPAGTAGFYFRNEIPSDYYVMIGSYGSRPFKQRATIVSVPKGVSVGSSLISDVPGFVTTFKYQPGSYPGTTPTVFNPNDSLTAEFSIATPEAIGSLQPLTEDSSFVVGYYQKSVDFPSSTLTYVPRVDLITYVCFS